MGNSNNKPSTDEMIATAAAEAINKHNEAADAAMPKEVPKDSSKDTQKDSSKSKSKKPDVEPEPEAAPTSAAEEPPKVASPVAGKSMSLWAKIGIGLVVVATISGIVYAIRNTGGPTTDPV